MDFSQSLVFLALLLARSGVLLPVFVYLASLASPDFSVRPDGA